MEYEIKMKEATIVKSEHEDDEDEGALHLRHTKKKNFQLRDLKCLVSIMREQMLWMHFCIDLRIQICK